MHKKRIHLTLMLRAFTFKWPKDQVFGFKVKYFTLVNNNIFLVPTLGLRVVGLFFLFPWLLPGNTGRLTRGLAMPLLTSRPRGGRKGEGHSPREGMGEAWFVQRGDERHPEISGSTFSAQGRDSSSVAGFQQVSQAAQTQAPLERGQRAVSSWC